MCNLSVTSENQDKRLTEVPVNTSKQMMSTSLTAFLESSSEEEVTRQSPVKEYHKITPHNKPHLRFIEENTRVTVVIYKNQCVRERHHATELRGGFFLGGGEESEWEKGERKRGDLPLGTGVV